GVDGERDHRAGPRHHLEAMTADRGETSGESTMRRRRGFTITELLVVMALIVFIMYILAEAFAAGAGAFRNRKAIGDMNEKLRSTSLLLRRGLQADRFEDKRRISDPDFWKNGPPGAGFLRVYNGSPYSTKPTDPYYYEGLDLDGNYSARAVDHG